MHTLIIVAHYDTQSLSHGIAAQISKGITTTSDDHSVEVENLFAEGFNPVFSAVDRATGSPPADVVEEQVRIDRADALVLVYPVYWWSMPALLKGWIDRVFVSGWAFDLDADGRLVKKLGHLKVHLVGIGGADADTYARHGYEQAMKTQIDHGIFDYCGAQVIQSVLFLDSETQDPGVQLEKGFALGTRVFTPGRTVEQVT